MAKNLFNYAAIDWYENELKKMNMTLPEYIKSIPLAIDGIEQCIYTSGEKNPMYPALSVGVHLEYWTYWLDFWLNDKKALVNNFSNQQDLIHYYSGASTREMWIETIRCNIKKSLENSPEYLVWHVANADFGEIITGDFKYTDRAVLKHTVELFNEVADTIPNEVFVLFENLWFPGLNTFNKDDVNYFFDKIKSIHEHAGIMLDTGHLMNTNIHLRTENDAQKYICSIIDNLGELAKLIKGIHLNASLSGEYQQKFLHTKKQILPQKEILNHIINVDRHKPFKSKAAKEIVQYIKPDYIVHELNYNDLQELKKLLVCQMSNL